MPENRYINNLKEYIKSLKASKYLPLRSIYYFSRLLVSCFRFFSDSYYRSVLLTAYFFKTQYHQRSVSTIADRYPLLFAICANYLCYIDHPKILSFGCATGEEVATIGKYLPNATIMGVDINKWCIQQCKRKFENERFSFCHSLSHTFTTSGNFDAIFCMAVFQRTENRYDRNNFSISTFTFSHFEEEIARLDKKLKINGLMIIDHADFSFADTSVYSRYLPLNVENNKYSRHRPLFDKANIRIADVQTVYRVFTKRDNKASH